MHAVLARCVFVRRGLSICRCNFTPHSRPSSPGIASSLLQVAALSIIEFLHRIFDIFSDYFGEVTSKSIRDNFSTAYQLLEETLDNGHPMITEPNALHSLIAPPTILGRMANFVTGKASNVGETLGEGAMSIIPWRASGVKYAQNEIFFDIIEEVDAIYER